MILDHCLTAVRSMSDMTATNKAMSTHPERFQERYDGNLPSHPMRRFTFLQALKDFRAPPAPVL
jgi:hypothetical protein